MRSIPSDLLTHYGQKVTTLAYGMDITREDSQIYGFTSNDEDATISGVLYSAGQGLDASAIVTAAGSSVGSLEIRTLNDGSLFNIIDILSGVWRNASFRIFRYNWKSVSDGVDVLLAGTLGQFKIEDAVLTVELRDLRQYLQQPCGSVSMKTCRYRLGSTSKFNGGLCLVDLEALRVACTVTSVTSYQIFRESALDGVLAYDRFGGGGLLTWTTGLNSGLTVQVANYDADGTFHLTFAMNRPVQVGDTFTVVPGCRKRREEDCRDKFDNVLNFGGEPDRPGIDSLTEAPTSNV